MFRLIPVPDRSSNQVCDSVSLTSLAIWNTCPASFVKYESQHSKPWATSRPCNYASDLRTELKVCRSVMMLLKDQWMVYDSEGLRSSDIYIYTLKTNLERVTSRWTLGSMLFLASWAAMMGPWTYMNHLISAPRLPFTATYFGSIALTLYFSLGVSVYIDKPFPPSSNNLILCVASKQAVDLDLGDYSNNLLDLVSG